MTPSAVAALLVGCALSACATPVDEAPPEAPSASPAPSAAPARRPERRYYLGRTAARCEFYFAEGDATSPPTKTPCPPDLEVGERIRVVGKTCVREGVTQPSREVPVVCPDPVTNFEKEERGEKARRP